MSHALAYVLAALAVLVAAAARIPRMGWFSSVPVRSPMASLPRSDTVLYYGQELKARVDEEFALVTKEYEVKLAADSTFAAKKPTQIATRNRITLQRWNEIEADVQSGVASDDTKAIHSRVLDAVNPGKDGVKNENLLQTYAVDNAGAVTDDIARAVKAMFPDSFCCSVFIAGKTQSGLHVFHSHVGANGKGEGLSQAKQELVSAFGQGMAAHAADRFVHMKAGKGKRKQSQPSSNDTTTPGLSAFQAPDGFSSPETSEADATMPSRPRSTPSPTPEAPLQHAPPVDAAIVVPGLDDAPVDTAVPEDRASLDTTTSRGRPSPSARHAALLLPSPEPAAFEDTETPVGLLDFHARRVKLRAQLPRRRLSCTSDTSDNSTLAPPVKRARALETASSPPPLAPLPAPLPVPAPPAPLPLPAPLPVLPAPVPEREEEEEVGPRPDWLQVEQLKHLAAQLGPDGRSLLTAFLLREVQVNDDQSARFSASNRPVQVANWVRDVRRVTFKPAGADTQKYRDSVVAWYTATSAGHSIGLREGGHSLESMQRAGVNGVYSLVTAISWWITHGGIDSTSSGGVSARELVADLTWILMQPLSLPDTAPTSSTARTPSAKSATTPKTTTSKQAESSSRATRASAAAVKASNSVKTQAAKKRTTTDAQLEEVRAPKRAKTSNASGAPRTMVRHKANTKESQAKPSRPRR
ncbi:hypothetical protein EXIGLDRAFT_702873 [Exidia glandulosa HHB12029]|uniref:Uncharacterized protein n=1 Tax=Exidia glandulosa HHB12029 TaxID=1314781 RepID=A0A165LCZ7_EXIGL|nr:hypothetical protein EXIGLDRAFT_702873 [Exidia glandulosa HHB12029]